MSITTLDSAAIAAELDGLGIRHDLAFKAAPAAPVSATITEKAGTGRVVAIVAVTGVEDEVRDIILPGAFRESLTKRMPKVCWHHAWEEPVGRTLSIEEWHPGDPRLPKQTKEGRPWPQAAGALVATAEFNLKSDRGREAFEAVRFFSESNECEWSIGYKVQPGQSAKDKQGRRHIKALDLFEYSFVLFGAAPLSMTLSMKSLQPLTDRWAAAVEAVEGKAADGADEGVDAPQGPAGDGEVVVDDDVEVVADDDGVDAANADLTPADDEDPVWAAADVDVDALHSLAMDEIEWDLVDVAPIPPITLIDEKALEETDDWRFEVGRKLGLDDRRRAVKAGIAMPDGSYPIGDEHDLRAALAWVESKGIDDENVRRHVARMATVLDRVDLLALPGGPEAKAGGADRNRGNAENLRNYYIHGAGAAQIGWGTDGDFLRCVAIAGKHMTTERAKGYCALRHKEATGQYPGRGHNHDGKKAATAPVQPEPVVEVKKAETMIGSGVMVALALPADIAATLAVADGNPPEEMHVTLAFLGEAADLNQYAQESLLAAATSFAGFCPPLSGTIGGIGMFPDSGSGVPSWVPVDVPLLGAVHDRLLELLDKAAVPASRTHGFTPHITLGYDLGAQKPVASTPVTFTHLVVAIGQEKHLLPLGAALTAGYDPTLDDVIGEVKASAEALGSFEEMRRRIESAVRDIFNDGADEPRPGCHTWVEATFPDRVIVTHMEGDETQAYEIDYVMTSSGEVVLSEPEKVTLVLGVVDAPGDPDSDDDDDPGEAMEDPGEDMPSAPPMPESPDAALDRYVAGLLADLLDNVEAVPVEGKAGRVLSGVNTERLRAAMQNLLTVLSAAGIDDILPPAPEDVASEKRADESTSAGHNPTPETTSAGAKSADSTVTIDHKVLMADLFGE